MNHVRTKNVLLLSPLSKEGVGGIAKWTQYIIDYYSCVQSCVNLTQFYDSGKISYGDTTLFQRLKNAWVNYVPLLFHLNKKLKDKHYDVVHVSTSASLGLIRDLIVIFICHKYGAKTVIHFHFGRIPLLFSQKNMEYKLLVKVIKNSDCAVTMTEDSYKTLVNNGFTNVALLPNPLSPSVTAIINQNKFVERDEKSVVFVGHVLPTKGVFELVDACNSICNIKLYLYGHISESIREQLVNRVSSSDTSWLVIKGEQSSDEVIKAMLRAGVFVLPTYSEGFPNVIIESMACGCPIVTTPVGAIPEMLDLNNETSPCGLCIPVHDTLKLRIAIERMLNDKDFALSCGNNARIRVNECYSMNVVWRQLERIWCSC